MANKKSEDKESRRAVLVMPADEFKHELETGISKADDLLNIQVSPNSSVSYVNTGTYIRHAERQYNSEELDIFEKSYHSWVDYYKELLKQAFDIQENDYLRDFEDAGLYVWMGNEDVMEVYRMLIGERKAVLERLIAKFPLLPKADTGTESKKATGANKPTTNKVFIVHGHDSNTRNEAELLVKQLDLDPVVLFKKPNMGDTIIEKLFRESNNVAFAIVLYTKCDEGKAVEESDYKPRARQNVVLEHGLMCGLLGRSKVVALVEEGIEVPGDLSGVIYISLDSAKRWQFDLAREMKAVGLPIDLNKLE